MLYFVSKLPQYLVWNIRRALADKVNADALGTDQLHDLHDLVLQFFGINIEQKMCLVKEEHDLRLVCIAYFRKSLIEFRKHPQQECCV